MQISTLIGKPVLSPSGETLGYVKNCYLGKNYTALSALGCVDNEEEEFFLPVRTVVSVGDAVIAGSARLNLPTGIKCPIGCAAYSACGEHLGIVRELTVEQENAFITVEKGDKRVDYDVKRLTAAEAVIVYPEGAKKPTAKSRPAQEKPATVSTPAPNPEAETAPALAIKPDEENAESDLKSEAAPAGEDKLYGRNLLGKRAKRSVTDENGVPLIRAGELITPAAIRKAGQSNRLLQLSANAF